MPQSIDLTLEVHGAPAMRRLGAVIARALPGAGGAAIVIALDGELGAGKTTLVSGLLESLGIPGPHRSPTYTLVEPYEAAGRRVSHLDLYRLAEPQELEAIGIRDLLEPGSVTIVEWAARANGAIGHHDVDLQLEYAADAAARRVTARAGTAVGQDVIAAIRSFGVSEFVGLSR